MINYNYLKTVIGEDCDFVGNKNLIFSKLQSIFESVEGDITWIKPGINNEELIINQTNASCLISTKESFQKFKKNKNDKLFIICEEPKRVFVKLLKHFDSLDRQKTEGTNIHPTAIVSKSCKIGKNVVIGAYSIIGSCTIGDNTVIDEFVKIYDCVKIGNDCIIREYSSIGGKGLGYVKNADNTLEHIPHIGSVEIEDNVHIYPFVNIDQGTLGATKIGRGTAIDHHVHIAHNCSIGENTIIVCGTVMAGGAKVLNDCFIGGNTQIKQKCVIGNRVITGMGSVVVKDIPNNEVWAGNPAAYLKNTPEQMF